MKASWLGLGLFVGLGLSVAAGCMASSMSADAMGDAGAFGANGGWTGEGGGDAGIDANLGDADPDSGPLTYSSLCGDGCLPTTDPDAGTCGGGAGGAGGGGAPEPSGCVLAYDANSDSVQGSCGPVGTLPEGSPCLSTTDCAPGLGCVGFGAGACRPYCCGDLEACAPGTYCSPEPLVSVSANGPNGGTDVLIPVCVLATQCTLLDDTTCTDGLTCTIVRVDGTTSCVEPGSGLLGEHCPCAAGFVCATGIDQCMKLCKIGQPEGCPASYTCQGGAVTYPEGFGVCVGTG